MSHSDTCFTLESPADIAAQHVAILPMTCFERLDGLMADGKGPGWVDHIQRRFPATGRGYWAWERLIYIQRHVKEAPQVPDLAGKTEHLLYKDEHFQTAFRAASRMVDKVCRCENRGSEAITSEGETRRYLIPACVAVIKALSERVGGIEQGVGSFMKVTLEVDLRALDWVYKPKEVVGDGDGWKRSLEEALEPLARSALGAMEDSMDEGRDDDASSGKPGNEEASGDGSVSTEEEESKGERHDGYDIMVTTERASIGENEEEESTQEGKTKVGESNDMAEATGEEGEKDAYSQLAFGFGLESESDLPAITTQATRNKRRRTPHQTAILFSEEGDSVTRKAETRGSLKRHVNEAELDSPPPPKRQKITPRAQTESAEFSDTMTSSSKVLPNRMRKLAAIPPWRKELNRSTRVRERQKPDKDGGRLGVPKWIKGPLYTTVYDGDGNGQRVLLSDWRGFLIRNSLCFFASKDERVRQR